MAPEHTSPAVVFADVTGGSLRWGDSGEEVAYPDGSYVYVSFRGIARLSRPGRPVADLGAWDSDPEALAASFRAEVA